MSTNFNNTVYASDNSIQGFRCFECGGVFASMWGNTCNGCREKERRHREMLAALRSSPTRRTDP